MCPLRACQNKWHVHASGRASLGCRVASERERSSTVKRSAGWIDQGISVSGIVSVIQNWRKHASFARRTRKKNSDIMNCLTLTHAPEIIRFIKLSPLRCCALTPTYRAPFFRIHKSLKLKTNLPNQIRSYFICLKARHARSETPPPWHHLRKKTMLFQLSISASRACSRVSNVVCSDTRACRHFSDKYVGSCAWRAQTHLICGGMRVRVCLFVGV